MSFTLITEEMLGIDNKKPEFKTFIIAYTDDYFYCDWSYILTNFTNYVNAIEKQILNSNGESGYLSYTNVISEYVEIQWD